VRSAGHSEIAAKLLTDLGADFHVFSEQALILQGNLSDFDSAIRTRLPLRRPVERHPLAGPFVERLAIGGERLLKPSGVDNDPHRFGVRGFRGCRSATDDEVVSEE
jgi:hypothetical protein